MFDFGLGATELMLIAVVALIVVGPKDLPRLMRWVGNAVAKVRAMAREFQGHLDEAMRETGLDEVRESVSRVREYTVADLDAEFEKLEREFRETALPDSPRAEAADRKEGREGKDDVVDLDEDLLDETERPVLALDRDASARDTGGRKADGSQAGSTRTTDRDDKRSVRKDDDGEAGPAVGATAEQGADAGARRAPGKDTGGQTT